MHVWKKYYLLPLVLPLIAVVALWGFGKHERSTSELIGDLSSRKESDRIVAVRTLKVRNEEAAEIVPALIGALKDRNSDVRISAAIKLGLFGESAKEAIPALKAAQTDRDVRVREAARTAISRIDPNESTKAESGK